MKQITKYFLFILDEIAIIIFVIALLISFDAPVSILIITIIGIIIVLSFITYVFLPQLKQPFTGSEGLIGKKAIALESFDHQGTVQVHGEQWNALSKNQKIQKGDDVIVVDVNGLTLTVEKETNR